jgi:hypothetical protein
MIDLDHTICGIHPPPTDHTPTTHRPHHHHVPSDAVMNVSSTGHMSRLVTLSVCPGNRRMYRLSFSDRYCNASSRCALRAESRTHCACQSQSQNRQFRRKIYEKMGAKIKRAVKQDQIYHISLLVSLSKENRMMIAI